MHAARLRRAPARRESASSARPSATRTWRSTRTTGYAVRYRHRWYRSSGYDPVYWGTYDPYWNDTDYRWFDDPGDDDDGGGFGDS